MDLLKTATSMKENSRAMVRNIGKYTDRHDVVWDLDIACEGVLQRITEATKEFCYKLEFITHRDIKENLQNLIPTP